MDTNQLAKFLVETVTNKEGLDKKASDPNFVSNIIEKELEFLS
jgi:hypothetical protein